MPKNIKITFMILFVLVLVSLLLNAYLIFYLVNLRQQALDKVREVEPVVQASLAQAEAELASFQSSTLSFTIQIDEELPIQVAIPISESLEIPIQMTFPVSETIETTVMIDPFQSGLEFPVEIAVPVDLEIPVDVVVPVPISRTIPFSTTVPVDLELPIDIKVSETALVDYVENIRVALTSLKGWLAETVAGLE